MASKPSKEVRAAIAKSGYLMEQRLASLIRSAGYYTTIPNYSFEDPETSESREIDIWAMGAETISGRAYEFIYPVLLIECKNLTAPLVVFTQQEIRLKELLGEVHLSGVPKEVLVKQSRHHVSDYLKFEQFHHYYQTGRIASQFCVVSKKKGALVAGHELEGIGNLYQRMVLPLVKAVSFEVNDHESKWHWEPGKEVINLNFYYPIIVTKGDLYECYVGGVRPRYRRVHRINFIRRYHSAKISGGYRIDVVTESGFRRLIRIIEDEVAEIARRIKRRRTILRESANLIAKEKRSEARRALLIEARRQGPR